MDRLQKEKIMEQQTGILAYPLAHESVIATHTMGPRNDKRRVVGAEP
jgi:hypothetical protein